MWGSGRWEATRSSMKCAVSTLLQPEPFTCFWERVSAVRADALPLSPSQEVFTGEMDGGYPSLPSTTSLVPLTHKAVPSGHAVITHFTALILITANVNMRIININAQNNAVICNYRVALIFFPYPLPPLFSLLSLLGCNHEIVLLWTDLIRLLYINIYSRQARAEYYRGDFHKFQCWDERVWVFSLEGGETRTKQEDFIVVNRRAWQSPHTITSFFQCPFTFWDFSS